HDDARRAPRPGGRPRAACHRVEDPVRRRPAACRANRQGARRLPRPVRRDVVRPRAYYRASGYRATPGARHRRRAALRAAGWGFSAPDATALAAAAPARMEKPPGVRRLPGGRPRDTPATRRTRSVRPAAAHMDGAHGAAARYG